MSEEAIASSDSKKVDNEATPTSNPSDDVNQINSSSNHQIHADTLGSAARDDDPVDTPTSSQNNLDLCSTEENCENIVNVVADTSLPPSSTPSDSQPVSDRIPGQEESEEQILADVYVVSNENTVEPSPTADTIENVGNLNTYRDSIIGDDTDSSDSESSSTVSEDDDVDSDNNSSAGEADPDAKHGRKIVKIKDTLGMEDLPPIEDLDISVDESKCKEIGTIDSIVDTQVVIQSFPNTPTLDLDTVLFLDRGKRPLGKIFDVLGNIHGPFYAVRFNSAEHIKQRNVEKRQTVYFVPESEYTAYVDTNELLKQKGSDASWKNNREPPSGLLDFSDDEDEARSKRRIAVVGSKRETPSDNEMFVKKMNQRNLELTAKRRKEDEAKQKRVPLARRMISNTKNAVDMSNANTLGYPHYADSYKPKSRSYPSVEPAATATRLVNFHHHAGSNPMNKFDPVSRFLVGSYSTPSNYAFPPQHFLCSSPRQLPNVVPNAQNYLTMYSRPSMQTSNALQPPPPPPPPFSSYNAAMPPNFTGQPGMHPLQPPLHGHGHGPMPPPQFSNFAPMSAPPMPSSIPQPYFTCADTSSMSQPAFIPMNVRPGLSTAAFHQFVLPPPPPPTTPSIQHHSHGREVALPRPDRRNAQPSHSHASYYPHSPYNS